MDLSRPDPAASRGGRARLHLLLTWVVAGLALAACNLPFMSTPSASSSPATDQGQAAAQYQDCMRQHGVTAQDNNGAVTITNPGANQATVQAAQQACRQFLRAGQQGQTGGNGSSDAAFNKLLQYAACMRQQGVDQPDPTHGPNGGIQIRPPTGASQAKLQAARQACANLRPNTGGSTSSNTGS